MTGPGARRPGRSSPSRAPACPAGRARGTQLRLRGRERRLRPRRLRGPGHRHAGPGARHQRALRHEGRDPTTCAPSSFPAGGRTCPPAPAATASCSWLRTWTATAADDLAIGAPGERDGQPSSGAVDVVYGGTSGLLRGRTRTIPSAVVAAMANFGVRLRAGDIDETRSPTSRRAPWARNAPRRATPTYCRSGERGPHAAPTRRPSAWSTSGLALGDVNGDGYADIVQGDSKNCSHPFGWGAGERRGRCGCGWAPRAARAGPPITITEDSPSIPEDRRARRRVRAPS